jgi:phosphonate dehydrogenase
MDRPKIVITNRVHEATIDILRNQCEVVANSEASPWSCDRLLEEARGAVGMMAFMTDCVDRHFLARCPNLQIIASVLKGFDNFNVEACTDRGIWLTVVSDRLTVATAELTIGAMIGISRHIVEGDAYVRRDYQGWRPTLYGLGLQNSTVGILGMGAVGQAVARRLKAFECQILYFDDKPLQRQDSAMLGARFTCLDEILSQSDFLVIALPLDARTQHLICAETLARMKPGCYLVNTARGSIVDEEAVADALGRGHLAGYAADVFEMEDLSRNDRPASISPRLLAERSRTVLTPHLGSADGRARQAAEIEMAQSILDYLSGCIPRGAVNNPGNRRAMAAC